MSHLLDRLVEDHRRLARLLDLLEGLLDQFRDGEEPDYELMCELLEYMIDYADQVHHPSEDMIFERLMASPEQKHDILRRLMQQHVALGKVNRRFRELLEGIVHEEVIRRDEVEELGRDMVAMLREHMRLEDEEVFPLARGALSEADWAELSGTAPDVEDPVFGHADPERFRAIYARLKRDMH